MKKVLAVVAIMLLIASVSSAQDIWGSGKMRAGAGGYVLLPSGTWGDLYGVGFGGFGKFEYGLNADMVLQGSIGYIIWSEKTTGSIKTSASAIPIDIGFKYNLKMVSPGVYAMASLGLWSITQKQENPAFTSGFFTIPASSIESSSSNDVLAIGAGYDTGMLDFNVRYTLNGNFANIVVGAAYNFGL